MIRNRFLIAFVFSFLAPALFLSPAQAYFSTMTTGEIPDAGQFRVTLEPQVILNKIEGLNVIGHLETGLAEDSSVEAVMGFGKVDFQIGGFFKYVPFPDVPGQPAIGVKTGVLYGRPEGESELSIRVHPLLSKKFKTDVGDLTSYGSIPFGLTTRDEKNVFPVQLAGGVDFKPSGLEKMRFMGEIGFNINKSFSYLSGGLVFFFDESGLFR